MAASPVRLRSRSLRASGRRSSSHRRQAIFAIERAVHVSLALRAQRFAAITAVTLGPPLCAPRISSNAPVVPPIVIAPRFSVQLLLSSDASRCVARLAVPVRRGLRFRLRIGAAADSVAARAPAREEQSAHPARVATGSHTPPASRPRISPRARKSNAPAGSRPRKRSPDSNPPPVVAGDTPDARSMIANDAATVKLPSRTAAATPAPTQTTLPSALRPRPQRGLQNFRTSCSGISTASARASAHQPAHLRHQLSATPHPLRAQKCRCFLRRHRSVEEIAQSFFSFCAVPISYFHSRESVLRSKPHFFQHPRQFDSPAVDSRLHRSLGHLQHA